MSEYILIVEDDASIREALSEALELEGYRVVGAQHGLDALGVLAGPELPCLVLLDLMMPVMDGVALRSAMLKDARLAAVPVVVLTAGGHLMASRVQASQVLHKPLRIDAVVKVVKEHCGGSRETSSNR